MKWKASLPASLLLLTLKLPQVVRSRLGKKTVLECLHLLVQIFLPPRTAFHDLRRAFATMNADRLSTAPRQTLMRHKSYQTTQVYINMARQIDDDERWTLPVYARYADEVARNERATAS